MCTRAVSEVGAFLHTAFLGLKTYSNLHSRLLLVHEYQVCLASIGLSSLSFVLLVGFFCSVFAGLYYLTIAECVLIFFSTFLLFYIQNPRGFVVIAVVLFCWFCTVETHYVPVSPYRICLRLCSSYMVIRTKTPKKDRVCFKGIGL